MNWAVKSLIIKLITLMCQTHKVSGADEREMIHYGNSI